MCDSHRIQQHKVLEGIAKRGKSSTGQLYGFKLHLVINDRREILNFYLTPCNVNDRNQKVMNHLTKDLSRHRICYNFVVNLVVGLVAYSFFAKKPSIYAENVAFA